MARYAEVARFAWKYRNAGVFKSEEHLSQLIGNSIEEEPIAAGTPEDLVNDLEAMGPAFIKIGQSLSTRPDLIQPAYIEALSKMQDGCEPIGFEIVRDIIERDLGVRLTKAFSEFDEKPLAAASLGQVHQACLRDGTRVAVKVQRPDVDVSVANDLAVLDQLALQADRFSETGRQVGFADWITQLRRSVTRELDYEAEAGNLETLAELLQPYPLLVVPRPVMDLTGRRVLTMEYIPGTKIPNRSGVSRIEEDGAALATQLTQGYLDQLFVHGFVHVDPHPGNVLLTDDGRLVILDLGMVTHLSPRMQEHMLSLVLNIVDGRGDEAAERAIQMGKQLEDFDRSGLIRSVSQLVSEYTASKGKVSEGLLMLQLTQISGRHGLRPPPEVVLLGKTLLNLEHLSLALAPDLEVREIVHNHLGELVQQRARDQLKPSAVISNLLEINSQVREMPRQVSQILSSLAENRLTVKVDAFDETRFAANMQKIANRVTVGLIVAALIVGAAMLMRIETEATLWGYPAFAMVCFLAAGLLGVGLVLTVLINDRERR